MNSTDTSQEKLASKQKNRPSTETQISFVISLITLFMIFGYFVQSAMSIHELEVISVAIDRINDR